MMIIGITSKSQPVLVITCLGERFVQFSRFIPRFLIDLQKSDPKTRRREHWNLELQTDRGFHPRLVLEIAAQEHFALQETFEFTLELLYSPHNGSVFGFVLGPPDQSVGGDCGRALGRRDFDHYIVGVEVFVVDGFQFDSDLQLVASGLGVVGHDFEGQIDVLGDSVAHEFEGSVWGDESNGAFFVEFGQFDALVELHIVNGDAFVGCGHPSLSGFLLHEQFVVHAQLALRHAAEFGVQLNDPGDVCPQDSPLVAEQAINVFDHIDVDLVLLVDDAFGTPGSHSRGLRGQLLQFFQIFQQLVIKPSFLNVVFKQSGVRKLGTAVVHDFVQNFVNEGELFFDIVLCDLPIAVCLADEDELVEELDGHGCVDVGFGGGQEDEIFVGDCDVADSIEQQNGVVPVLLGGDYLRAVMLDLLPGDIVFEGTVDKYLPFDVDEHHRTDHLDV